MPEPLALEFYRRDPLSVARDLLGAKLVRVYQGQRLEGVITEVEAYFGSEDSASHAFRGVTPRNRVMFGEAGHAYVYLVYGLHRMLNLVTSEPGTAGAVLIRAVEPLQGIEVMRQLRQGQKQIASGPGKLCQAFAIDGSLNGWDLTRKQQLWIEPFVQIHERNLWRGPRVGIAYAQPEHRDALWRLRAMSIPVQTAKPSPA